MFHDRIESACGERTATAMPAAMSEIVGEVVALSCVRTTLQDRIIGAATLEPSTHALAAFFGERVTVPLAPCDLAGLQIVK
jgi:hypothetical protein